MVFNVQSFTYIVKIFSNYIMFCDAIADNYLFISYWQKIYGQYIKIVFLHMTLCPVTLLFVITWDFLYMQNVIL